MKIKLTNKEYEINPEGTLNNLNPNTPTINPKLNYKTNRVQNVIIKELPVKGTVIELRRVLQAAHCHVSSFCSLSSWSIVFSPYILAPDDLNDTVSGCTDKQRHGLWVQ